MKILACWSNGGPPESDPVKRTGRQRWAIGLTAVSILTTLAATAAEAAGVKGNPQDEGAVRRVLSHMAEARNTFNAKGIADAYAEEGQSLGLTGRILYGRAEIEKSWRDAFARPGYKGGQAARHINSIRFIRPDVAVVEATVQMTGLSLPTSGSAIRNPKLIDFYVMTKNGGHWQIASSLQMLPVGATSQGDQQPPRPAEGNKK
ncbi:MAG TPA: SgcJ/EcaC family oxidoreductase [Bryobacterales bacterium]|nr:SgcJ/EcaC family oxidoreductase [Bryobacterales bacterium]